MVKNENQIKAVGTDDFKDLVLRSDIFVDKSLLIKDLIEDSSKIILITRPRRWGKSLNMSMVRRFLELEVNEHGKQLPQKKRLNRKLFLGGEIDLGLGESKILKPLAVAKHENIIKHQGQFPVISISLKGIKGNTYAEIEEGIKWKVFELFNQYSYLSASSKLSDGEKLKLRRYLAEQITSIELQQSLGFLSKLLRNHFGQKVWVLIDEYDTTINSAYISFSTKKEEFEKVLDLFREFLGAALKTNDALEQGFITGILRIAKAELFSGLNNLAEYSLLDDGFAKCYGFTQQEVEELLKQVPINESPKRIKDWYNGYTFGGELIYNPWSIMRCLGMKGKLDTYWIDSGGTAWIDKTLISDQTQQDLQSLVAGRPITYPIERQIVFNDIDKPVGLFSLLLFSGYLNPIEAVNTEENIYKLSIPNKEVSNIYRKRLLEWVQNKLDTDRKEFYSFIILLADGKVEEFKNKLQEMLQNSTSFHQTGIKNSELFYNGFMLGLAHSFTGNYSIESEREAGDGRPDIVLIPVNTNYNKAIIIEYKLSKTKDDMAQDAQKGLKQIIDKNYDAKLKRNNYVKQIVKIGLAFHGKHVEMCYKVNDA